MNIQISNNSQILTYGLPLLVILTAVTLALSPLLVIHHQLAMGITYDLTLTAPLLYFFLIRNKKISKITVVPFFVLGIILATFLLPEQQHYHLNLVTSYLLPLVEIAFFSLIIYHGYKGVQAAKALSTQTHDYYLIIKESAVKAIGYPKVAKVFATEIAMLYYAFFAWKAKPKPVGSFTNFKKSGSIALLAVVVFLIIVETFVLHLLLVRWHETLAWLLTLSSFYASIQLIAHIKALKQRTSELKDNTLHLTYGLFGDLEIDLSAICRIELTNKRIEAKGLKVQKLALLKDIEPHNLAIYFSKPQFIEKAYGLTQPCDVVLLYIDNPKDFTEALGF